MSTIQIDKSISYRTYKPIKDISKTIIYNSQTQNYVFLEGASSEIFSDLTSECEIDFIQKYSDEGITQADFDEFIDVLTEQGIIKSSKLGTTLDSPVALADELDACTEKKEINEFCSYLSDNGYIFSFHFDLTNACNEKCKHCYHPFNKYVNKSELDLDSILKVIDDAYDKGVFRITLSGGEALLHEHFERIVKHIRAKHMMCVLFTNGLLLTNYWVDFLTRNGCALVSISLYGSTADVHDQITGIPGSFEKTIHAIRLVTGHGLPVELKCVVLKDNYKDIKNIECLAQTLACKIIFDYTLTGKLDGDDTPYSYGINENEFGYLVKNKVFNAESCNGSSFNLGPCKAGIYGIYMDPYGDIFPCVSFRLLLGNYRDIEAALKSDALSRWKETTVGDFSPCGTHEYCKHCIEICAGINMIENQDYLNGETTMCKKAKVLHSYYATKGE